MDDNRLNVIKNRSNPTDNRLNSTKPSLCSGDIDLWGILVFSQISFIIYKIVYFENRNNVVG